VIHSGAKRPSAGPSTDTPTSSCEQSRFYILQQIGEGEVHGTARRGKQYWDTSDDSEGELYSPLQSTDASGDRMEFVVEEEAEEDDGTRIEETPQVHSANEVAIGAHELDVQVVVPSTTENTPTRIPESPEALRTMIDDSRQEDGTLQPESIVSEKEWQLVAPDIADPLLDNSQVGVE
jgi:hypothetical protein